MIPSTRFSRKAPTKFLTPLVMALFLIGMDVEEAHAYLDPGTGSILLQGTLALIAGTAVTLRLYWSKLKGLIWRAKPSSNEQAGGNE